MEIIPLGDSALLVRVCETAAGISDESLSAVLNALHKLQNAEIPGVIELAPAYAAIGLFFNPASVISVGAKPDAVFEWMAEKVREAVSQRKKIVAKTTS